MTGIETSRERISHLNFENPPTGHLLGQETLKKEAAQSQERGEDSPHGEGVLTRLENLENIIYYVPIDLIIRNQDQPRTDFDEQKMNELHAMILEKGQRDSVLTVPIVHSSGEVKLILIDGERRWRILKELEATYIRVEIQFEKTFRAIYEAAAIVNLGSAKHNPIEEAHILDKMVRWAEEEDELNRPEAIASAARKIGKSENFVKERLALLELDKIIQKSVIEGLNPGAALELQKQKQRHGDQVNVLQVAQTLLDDPEETFDSEQARKKHLAQITREQVRARVRTSMKASGSEVGKETADMSEASELILDFVSSLTTLVTRAQRLLDNQHLHTTAIEVMKQRRGYPPDIIFEKTEAILDLVRGIYAFLVQTALQPEIPEGAEGLEEQLTKARDALSTMLRGFKHPSGTAPDVLKDKIQRLLQVLAPIHENIVVPALKPPALKIPEGAPTFTNHIRKSEKTFESALRHKIAIILAEASDNDGSVLTSAMVSEKLKAKFNLPVSAHQVGTHIQQNILKELRKIGLSIDTQIVRRRSAQGTLDKVTAYRLTWLPQKKTPGN